MCCGRDVESSLSDPSLWLQRELECGGTLVILENSCAGLQGCRVAGCRGAADKHGNIVLPLHAALEQAWWWSQASLPLYASLQQKPRMPHRINHGPAEVSRPPAVAWTPTELRKPRALLSRHQRCAPGRYRSLAALAVMRVLASSNELRQLTTRFESRACHLHGSAFARRCLCRDTKPQLQAPC